MLADASNIILSYFILSYIISKALKKRGIDVKYLPRNFVCVVLHSVSLIHCPDEIRHNSAGIPAVPFKEPLPAYSSSVLSVST
jgi:hypothetical protein